MMYYCNWCKYWPQDFIFPPTPVHFDGRWWELWETTDGEFFLKQSGMKPMLIGSQVQADEFLNEQLSYIWETESSTLGEPASPESATADDGEVPLFTNNLIS